MNVPQQGSASLQQMQASDDEGSVLRQHHTLHVQHLLGRLEQHTAGLQEEQMTEVTRRMELLFAASPGPTNQQALEQAIRLALSFKESWPLPELPAASEEEEPSNMAGLNLAVQNAAVLRFKELEERWIRLLPEGSPLRRVGHCYGEVGFVLAGVKACFLFCFNTDDRTYNVFMAQCLQTIVDEFGLEQEGFRSHVISHPLLTSNTHPRHRGFQGGVVFVNHNHAHFPLVNSVFLTPHPGRVPEVLVGQALGYPCQAGNETVQYMNETECGPHQQHQDCMMMEYWSDERTDNDFPAIMKHFQAYRRAFARQLGQQLTIDFEKCPRLQAWFHSPAGSSLDLAEQSF